MSKRYVRRLSALERYSLVINEICRYHVDAVVEGVGDVDPQVLQAAVDRAADANPGVRVRLRGVLGWSKWVDSGIAPRVRLLSPADWDGSGEVNAPFLNERLDPLHGGPVADVLIVPCKDGLTRLVFRTVHAAIDGRGLMHWGSEVFRALRGEALQGSHSTVTDLDIQRQYRDRIAEAPEPAASCIPVLAPAQEGRELRYVWRRAVIAGGASQLLQLLPKTAAFLAAWARRREPGEVRFTIPVDYRGLRTHEMSVGNLLGYLRLTVPEGASPRSLMQQINRSIRAFGDCRSLPGARLLLWVPVRYMVRKLRNDVDALLYTVNPGLPTGGIVSMGGLKTERYCFPGFQAKTISGIPGSVGKLNVVFVGCDDFVTVVFATPAAYNRHGQLDELVRAYEQHFSKAELPTCAS
jgi:hypothetical protein